MRRRGFLGALGAVIAAPKAIPKGVTPATMTGLEIPGIAPGLEHAIPISVANDGGRIGWASNKLKKLLGLKKDEEAYRIKTQWINGMDEDTAALKSMSLVTKVRRTRRVQYFRQKQQNETLLRGIMGGFFEDE